MIICCDDFGLHKDIDRAILDLCSLGKVDAVSVVPCGKNFEHSINELVKYSETVEIGIHTTWVGEKSILPESKVPSIVSKNNHFSKNFVTFYMRWMLGLIDIKHLELELEAQIKKLLGTKIQISHLDSHQHLHMIPSLFKSCLVLAENYKIPRIRLTRERIDVNLPKQYNLLKWLGEKTLGSWANINATHVAESNVKSCSEYFGLKYSGNFHKISSHLTSLIQNNRNRDIEINFHPAAVTKELLMEYPWNKGADFDYQFLKNI